MDDTTPEFSWSTDEERFTGRHPTRAAALAEARAEEPDARTVWVGENFPWAPSIDGERAAERDAEAAGDECGEFAEDYAPDRAGAAALDELGDALTAVYREWLRKHALWPRFWMVGKVEKHEYAAEAAVAVGAGRRS